MTESSRSPRDVGPSKQPSALGGIGAPMNVADERQIMREAMGASYDFKWVAVGMALILVLQFGTIAVIWKLAGKKFLVGTPRRSLLEASIESVDDNYGSLKGGDLVRIKVKVDQNGKNTADRVTDVWFGKTKAARFLPEKLKREERNCVKRCEEGKKVEAKKAECNQACGNAKKLLAQADRCQKVCREKCGAGKCKEDELVKMDPDTRSMCIGCPEKVSESRKADVTCRICTPKVEFFEAQKRQCKMCDAILENLRKNLKTCQSDGRACYALLEYDRRKEIEAKEKAKPKQATDEKSDVFELRLKGWEKELERMKNQLFTLEKRTAYAYVPASAKAVTVPVVVRFSTGYKVRKEPGYTYVENVSAGRPSVKKAAGRDDPTSHAGFWIMLGLSLVVYFLGGMLTGRLSPGITMKEPATAGIFAGIGYFLFLLFIGGDFSVVIFSSIIGVPAFAGAAYVGGWVGEKWQGTL